MLSCGIEWLHIDVMRKPFIPSRDAFTEESMHRLYDEFGDDMNLDFHLMVSQPDSLIETIDKTVPSDRRGNTNITIHREAYRLVKIGKYGCKEHDLLRADTGNASLDAYLRGVNTSSGDLVHRTLNNIKESGYKAGLALEPGTSLKNISEDMINVMDMLLLMSVSSGAGGQGYMHAVTGKIREARQNYGSLMIQVDGGINERVLPEVIEAGANNIVIGSYITKAENLADRIDHIRTYIK